MNVTQKDFYEHIEKMKKEEQNLRHEQANRFQSSLESMKEEITNEMREWFSRLEWVVEKLAISVKENYSTKLEHQESVFAIKKLEESESKVWKIIWWVVTFVFTWIFSLIGAAILYFIRNT